jgi:hypothetical protein
LRFDRKFAKRPDRYDHALGDRVHIRSSCHRYSVQDLERIAGPIRSPRSRQFRNARKFFVFFFF